MPEWNRFTLLSDEPCTSGPRRGPTGGDDPADPGDALGFGQVAGELADTIVASRRSTPFSLGIEGGWGSGKSSLMHQLDGELKTREGVTTVWFNAWSAEGAGALEGLIKTALESLDRNILRKALRKVLRNRQLMGLARFAVLVATSRLGGRGLVNATWERFSVDASARNQLRDLVKDVAEQWHAKSGEASGERLLVMFVDDLDRASPAQVFEIFEAVKLYLAVPGFVFVIGYDHTVVSEAVLEEKKYSRSVTGREYLEKIIQVGYRVTTPDDDQAQRLLDRYTAESGTAELFDEAARRLVIDRNQRNPRRIKRFLNYFVLLYALDPDWKDLGAQRLVEVLLLDTHFSELTGLFRAGTDDDPISELLEYHQARAAVLADATSDVPEEERLRELEHSLPELYPRLVGNAELMTLVESLRASDEWVEVRNKLQRRSRPVAVVDPGLGYGPGTNFTGSQSARPVVEPGSAATNVPGAVPVPLVLWIGDQPTDLGAVIDSVTSAGMEYSVALDAGAARRSLAARPYRHVVVEVEREAGPDVGFDDLPALREGDLYLGPVTFYTRRLTPERRERAESMGASIVSDPAELQSLLARFNTPMAPPDMVSSVPVPPQTPPLPPGWRPS